MTGTITAIAEASNRRMAVFVGLQMLLQVRPNSGGWWEGDPRGGLNIVLEAGLINDKHVDAGYCQGIFHDKTLYHQNAADLFTGYLEGHRR